MNSLSLILTNQVGWANGRFPSRNIFRARWPDREHNVEAAAWQAFLVFAFRFHPNTAAVGFNYTLGNRQAKPRASALKFGVSGGMQLRIANAAQSPLPADAHQPFRKGEHSSGLGLGLAIVQRLSEHYGLPLSATFENGQLQILLPLQAGTV